MSTTATASAPATPMQQLQTCYPLLPAKLLQQLLDINGNDPAAAAAMLTELMEQQQKSKSASATSKPAWDGRDPTTGEQMSRCQLYGTNASQCGYCQHEPTAKGRVSFGLVTPKLQCSDYQQMIDVGWRRSGDYCYKPDNVNACCKQYTIRLDVHQFKPNKKQRQCLNRWERYIQTGEASGEQQQQQGRSRRNSQQSDNGDVVATTHAKKQRTQSASADAATATTPLQQLLDDIHHDLMAAVAEMLQLKPGSTASPLPQLQQQIRVYLPKPTKPSAAQAASSDLPAVLSTNAAWTLGKHLKSGQQSLSDTASQLVDTLNRTNQREGIAYAAGARGYINVQVAFERWRVVAPTKPQTSSRKPSPARPRSASNASQTAAPTTTTASAAAHQWSVTHHPAQFTSETYTVYKKYQIVVHGDKAEEVTEKGYKNFLCKSPLFSPSTTSNHDRPAADTVQYGSFHTHYRIDGKLVAVGVVDILPSCLSSVYVYYDPDYDFLRLGTLTALLEIQRIKQELSTLASQLHYYYMGYYIHDCVKMRYKGEYEPSELLCPVRYSWHPLDAQVRAALSTSKFVVFSDLKPEPSVADNTNKQNRNTDVEYQVNKQTLIDCQKQQVSTARRILPTIPIVFRQQLQIYSALPSFVTKQLQTVLLEYVQLIGEAVALRMAVVLD